MPRPRFARLDPAKQEAILRAALDTFASEGFEGASFNHIIEKSGISKGAMYYYFDDKEDLFATVVHHELDELLQEMLQLPEVEDAEGFWRVITDMMVRALAFVAAEPKKIMLLRTLIKQRTEGSSSALVQEMHDLAHDFSASMLRLGQSVGAVRTDIPFDLLVDLIRAMDDASDHWMVKNLDLSDMEALVRHTGLVVDLIRRLCTPEISFLKSS